MIEPNTKEPSIIRKSLNRTLCMVPATCICTRTYRSRNENKPISETNTPPMLRILSATPGLSSNGEVQLQAQA